jgi:tRNA 2-thiouridine synthesizing protein A
MAREVLLDVSELEPPEPLVQSIGAVEQLKAGEYLHLLHRREPCLLYDNLTQRGFASETRAGREVACEVFIWREGDTPAEQAARAAAATLPPMDRL